jgi:integrase
MTLSNHHSAWNKGKLVGQKQTLKFEEIWRIRIHLEINNALVELALFNLVLDSKLRACDLLKLKVRDIMLVFFRLIFFIYILNKTRNSRNAIREFFI